MTPAPGKKSVLFEEKSYQNMNLGLHI